MNTRRTLVRDRIRWLPRVPLRRRSPRFEIEGSFCIDDTTTDSRVELLDVSLGGFRATSSADLRPGTVRTFRFPLGSSEAVTLSASVVHCYPVLGRTSEFTVGWAWANAAVNVEGLPIGALAILDYLSSEHSPVTVRQKAQSGRRDQATPEAS